MIVLEYEVRFYFSLDKINYLVDKLSSIQNLEKKSRSYEKTIQYDHPSKELSFYKKEVDGRFRVRITKNDLIEKCKISWKKRLSDTTDGTVNKEEEVEVNVDYSEYNNLLFLLENVLKMIPVESYERYRTVFLNDEVEISVDEYPFGIALEVESISDSVAAVSKWTSIIGLDIKDAYRLSWDDKYSELCKSQGIEQYNHVTFDLPMPKIED